MYNYSDGTIVIGNQKSSFAVKTDTRCMNGVDRFMASQLGCAQDERCLQVLSFSLGPRTTCVSSNLGV